MLRRGLGLCCAVLTTVVSLGAQQQQPSSEELLAAAKKGNFDAESALKALEAAGLKGKDLADWLKWLKETADGQNASFKGDWDLGQVFRDRDYKLTYPLDNHCKVAQKVTITYPKS